jgi:hypothetical protein
MNPLTQFKRLSILPVVVALTLLALAAFTPAPALATRSCDVLSENLLHPK